MRDYDNLQDVIFTDVDNYKNVIRELRRTTLDLAVPKNCIHADDPFSRDLSKSNARMPPVGIKHRETRSLTKRPVDALQSTKRLNNRTSSKAILRNSAGG